MPPAPLGLHAAVTGTTALITWQAEEKSKSSVTGFQFYLDETAPLSLGAEEHSRQLTHLATGREYFVQVVAVTRNGTSLPVGMSFSTAFVEPKSTEQPAQPPAPSAKNPSSSTPSPSSSPPTRKARPQKHTITGTLTLLERRNYDKACTGLDGYSDIYAGQKVVAHGAAGQIIGLGSLGAGHRVDSQDDSELGEAPGTFVTYHCRFSFSISDLPASKFYSITTATREGGPIYTSAEMQASNWRIQATIGDDS